MAVATATYPALPADVAAAAVASNQELAWLPVAELRIDPRYQRPLDMGRVRRMAKDFDADAFGVLYVSKRQDGQLWLIDGQHRQALMFEIGYGDQTVACLVFSGLTFEQEARVFRLANSGSRPNALALFKAALAEGDHEAEDIDRTVRRVGLQVGAGGNQRTIQAIAAVRRVYRECGGLVLERVLRHIVEAWGSNSSNFQSDILLGLALVEKRYARQTIDRERLRAQLQTTTVNSLLATGRARKDSGSGNIWADEIPDQVIKLYNKGLRVEAKKLPTWERRTNVREVWS